MEFSFFLVIIQCVHFGDLVSVRSTVFFFGRIFVHENEQIKLCVESERNHDLSMAEVADHFLLPAAGGHVDPHRREHLLEIFTCSVLIDMELAVVQNDRQKGDAWQPISEKATNLCPIFSEREKSV